MLKIFRSLTLSALVGLGGLGAIAATPSTAEAASGSIYLGFGSGHNQGVNFRFDDRGRHHYRDHRRGPASRYVRECSPRQALNKASRMGMRNARIANANRRTIKVIGHTNRHRPAGIIFGKAPSCPILR